MVSCVFVGMCLCHFAMSCVASPLWFDHWDGLGHDEETNSLSTRYYGNHINLFIRQMNRSVKTRLRVGLFDRLFEREREGERRVDCRQPDGTDWIEQNGISLGITACCRSK